MKKQLQILLITLLVCLPSLSAATKTSLVIEVRGLEDEIKTNVERFLEAEKDILPMKDKDIRHFHETANTVIKNALSPFGYLQPTVKKRLHREGHSYRAVYEVGLGPPTIIERFHFKIHGDAKQDKDFIKLLTHPPIKVGDRFKAAVYENFKDRLFELSSKKGYRDAGFLTNLVRIDRDKNRASIVIIFSTGKRYRFGRVAFSDHTFNPRFLARFVEFKEREPYDDVLIEDLETGLNSSSLFQDVLVKPEFKKSKNHLVPVAVKLQPKKAKLYTLGLGYSTDIGERIVLSSEFRRLNSWGHHVVAHMKASRVEADLEASYVIPGRHPAREQFKLTAALEDEDENKGERRTKKLVASYVTHFDQWVQTSALNLQREDFIIKRAPEETSSMLIPSVGWLYIKSDEPLKPSKGTKVNIEFHGASRDILSDVDFWKVKLETKFIRTFKRKNRFVGRLDLGHVNISNLTKLPLSLQQFTGGARDLRAYRYREIGPGEELVNTSLEYQRKVYKNLYLAFFVDAGNASNHFHNALKKGVGTGLVWLSPVGAIQASVARALDIPEKPIRFQLMIGPEL